jgi:hypothetical protein
VVTRRVRSLSASTLGVNAPIIVEDRVVAREPEYKSKQRTSERRSLVCPSEERKWLYVRVNDLAYYNNLLYTDE